MFYRENTIIVLFRKHEFVNHSLSNRRENTFNMHGEIAEDTWIRLKNVGKRISVERTRNKIYPRNLSSLSFSADILHIISASLLLTTVRSEVFHVWQRKGSLRRRVRDPSRGQE